MKYVKSINPCNADVLTADDIPHSEQPLFINVTVTKFQLSHSVFEK